MGIENLIKEINGTKIVKISLASRKVVNYLNKWPNARILFYTLMLYRVYGKSRPFQIQIMYSFLYYFEWSNCLELMDA